LPLCDSRQNDEQESVVPAVKAAIATLKEQNAPIDFKSVAKLCGVSRKTLYASSEAKRLIMFYRNGGENDFFAKIAALENENKRLKNILRAVSARIKALELDP
jgi:hypothetical protein